MWLGPLFVLISAVLSATQEPASTTNACVSFQSGRINAGTSFTRSIGYGLEVRLTANDPVTWDITVGPVREKADYLWVVSPPFHFAAQLTIGGGYGMSAAQSAGYSPRHLRFVTSKAQYRRAAALVDRALHGQATIPVGDIERLGKGRLDLTIRDFAVNPSTAKLDWIRVTGRACRPDSSRR